MKAILVVSFGTSVNETRVKTIDAVEQRIRQTYKDYIIIRAFTSKMIIKKLMERDGLVIPTVEQALAQLVKDNCQELIIQPTHIINGIENDVMLRTAASFRTQIPIMKIGTPLLTTTEDQEKVIHILGQEFSSLPKKEAIIWMGHGSGHYVNSVYAGLDYMMKEKGYPNFYMGTAEAYPSIDHIIKQLPTEVSKIYLCPFMLVAGNHAKHDMAGQKKDSWSQILQRKGYEVQCILKGLGEYPKIQKMYLEHISAVIGITH